MIVDDNRPFDFIVHAPITAAATTQCQPQQNNNLAVNLRFVKNTRSREEQRRKTDAAEDKSSHSNTTPLAFIVDDNSGGNNPDNAEHIQITPAQNTRFAMRK